MEKYLAFVTIDVWTLIFTWANLLILFLLMKKFFFKPIKNILKQREDEINSLYEKANSSSTEAEKLKEEYENRLKDAKKEASEIVGSAVKNAEARGNAIVDDAKKEARGILDKAEREIEQEKTAAVNEIKGDILNLAVNIAQKVIEKDLKKEDHEKMIDDIISKMGE